MKYKVGDMVEMKIIPITTEGPHYTARMREAFINNPEVEIIGIIDEEEYYVKDYRESAWKVLERWIVGDKATVSYFIS